MTDWCLDNGVAGLSLRSLAAAVGSNNRMLLYYFDSKEQLITDALHEAARRHWPLTDAAPAAPGELERWLCEGWRAVVAPRNRLFLRLFLEVSGLAVQAPDRFAAFLAGTGSLPALVEASLRNQGVEARAAADATAELVALWRGLQYAVVTGGSIRQLNRVHDAAVTRLLADLGVGTAQ